jgi:hypothetical protein
LVEIPSFVAGLIAFAVVFVLLGIMFFVLREERDRTIPIMATIGPADVAKFESMPKLPDAPFLAIVTLVIVELIVDALIVVTVLQGAGSFATGTMLALAVFLAAAILAVYRSNFMGEAFLRKPRLEKIAYSLLEETENGEQHGGE